MRTLLTGANGFIGSRLLKKLSENPSHEVVGIDIKRSSWNHSLPINELDLRNFAAVTSLLESFQPNTIILSGAIKGLENCEKSIDAAMVNVFSLQPFITYALKHDAHVIFLSSDMVFGGCHGAPFDELSLIRANNAYGSMKIAGEQLVSMVARHTNVRTALVYGPLLQAEIHAFDQSMREPVLGNQSWLPIWVATRGLHGDTTNLAENIFCTPTYIDDLTNDLLTIVEQHVYGVIHSCGPDRISRYAMGQYIAQLLGTPGIVKSFLADSAGGLRPLDVSLLDTVSRPRLQKQHVTDIYSGIRKTLQQSGFIK